MSSDQSGSVSMYRRREQLEQRMREESAFLIAQHGYLETLGKREAMFTSLYYVKQPVGFRMILDYRDQTVYPDLIRLPQGLKDAVGYIVDDQVVRVPLFLLFEDMLHIEDKQITSLAQSFGAGSLDFQGALEGVIQLREIIERYLEMVEAQSSEELFPSVEVFNLILRSPRRR
jgi:hypothetical protein